MIFNQELKDKIEDALIHFEDAGYSYKIYHDFFCSGRFSDKVYDLLKKVNSNEDVEFGDRIYISLWTSTNNYNDNVMTWKQYQWYQSELKTAITRMTDNLDSVNIIKTTDSKTEIEINEKKWKFKNLKDLSEKCRYFNANNKFSGKILVYPEYHEEEGIVLYVREIPTEKNSKRFDLLEKVIESEYTFNDVKQKHGDQEVIWKKSLNLLNPRYVQSTGSVSLEKSFGEGCLIKKYEEGQVEKENPYLQGPLTKYIVAKIKCDFIK